MIGEGTRQLDLYDFFSIFIPGATLLLGLTPFLPTDSNPPAAVLIAVLIIGGVVLGRAIHATRLWAEEDAGVTSHRDRFISELITPDYITDDLADQFYNCCQEQFQELSLPENRSQLDRQKHGDDLNMLYSLIRSHIHIDARGRSRTFQAVLDFYGSIWIVSFFLVIIYAIYSTLKLFNALSGGVISYGSYLQTLGIHPTIIFSTALVALGGAYITFRGVRSDYRNIYIQYFISDFIVLQRQSEN
ncbi:hypothetical protein [Haloarcula pellucida]|uniref:hypothetical protein n=1 Tax=Haloarcula pellucida TaxID=1427151 RepID=UPI0016693099|nr:hypothetical protein [Halomicroarcula pellucida]MBX0346596.1 hypothetical protein [Halomicroarcula pellucida]